MRNFWLHKRALHMPAWDFDIALGDQISQKYKSEYIKVMEIVDVGVIRQRFRGKFQEADPVNRGRCYPRQTLLDLMKFVQGTGSLNA